VSPRAAAFAALRDAEAAAKMIPDAVTVPTVEQIRNTGAAFCAALRRALEWLDEIETP
jgi:hypothetical protein